MSQLLVHARCVRLAYMNFPKGPEPGPVTEMKPLGSASDREEARRARLLENAAREARERKLQCARHVLAEMLQSCIDIKMLVLISVLVSRVRSQYRSTDRTFRPGLRARMLVVFSVSKVSIKTDLYSAARL